MNQVSLYGWLSWLIIFWGCQAVSSTEQLEDKSSVVLASAPTENTSGEPNLYVSESGEVYLSWIESQDSIHFLRYAIWKDDQWSHPRTIGQGKNWFVNWADFPSMVITDSMAVAHWLQKSAEGTYDYDIHITLSQSTQHQWNNSFVLHQDGVAAEHGFVTLLPLSATQVLGVWLDGRRTKEKGGAMSLYANTISPLGTTSPGQCLDDRVCDCCQTDAALTPAGPVVVYRNRNQDEIRDIYVVRKTALGWSDPYTLYQDGWQIAGCPVNGPAIGAHQEGVAVAWFTAADNQPKVQVVFSDDQGKTFGEPVRVDASPPLGRVDIEMINATTAVVSWMESIAGKAVIQAVAVTPDGKRGVPLTLAEVRASRSSGFPIIAQAGERLYCAWTQQQDSTTTIQTAWIPLGYFESSLNVQQ